MHESELEVAVVGAGQAGLAMGYFLQRQGRRFLILEARSIASAVRAGTESRPRPRPWTNAATRA